MPGASCYSNYTTCRLGGVGIVEADYARPGFSLQKHPLMGCEAFRLHVNHYLRYTAIN